ncbi:putative Ig domain-containing protein [Myxococcota bacterium]|nr:putative Ig domain-containing protein [Myxococcota bacterium]
MPPYTWSIVDGALPDGLTLDPRTARICGTAREAGERVFVARVEDARGDFDSERFTLFVEASAALTITTTKLPGAILTRSYSTTLTATGGRAPFTWSLEGALPPGLALSSDGVIRGEPTTAGVFAFAVRARDASGAEDVAALSIEARRIDGGGLLDTAEGTGCTSTTPHGARGTSLVVGLLVALFVARRLR